MGGTGFDCWFMTDTTIMEDAMKRYKQKGIVDLMREDEDGEFLKYEDVKLVIASLLWRNDFATDEEMANFIRNS